MRRVVLVLLLAAAALAAVTLVALEGRGIAVLITTSADGQERRTRVWYAEVDDALWVESATAERPFYVDLAARPDLLVEIHPPPFGGDHSRLLEGTAELVPEPGGHDRIRALLAARYGWADAWVALLQDTSRSRAVVVHPRRPQQP